MRTLMLLAVALPAAARTLVDLRTQAKRIDFTAATSTKPLQTGTVLPAACGIGAMFYKSDAPAGQNLYGCTALNTWTQMSGGGNVNTDVVNTFTRGQVVAGQQDQVQLDITGNSTQTNPVLRVRTAAGSNLIQANADGSVNLGAGAGPMTLIGNNGAAPPTPPSGQTALYYSATAKLAQTVDDAGNQATMVRPNACAGQVVQSIAADGTITCASAGGNVTSTDTLQFAFCADGVNAANQQPGAHVSYPISGSATPFGASMGGGACYVEFANSGASAAYVPFVLPANWTGNIGVGFRFFQSNGGASGHVGFNFALYCFNDGDDYTSATWTSNATVQAVPGDYLKWKTVSSSTVSTNGTCSGGSNALLRIQRDNTLGDNYGAAMKAINGYVTYQHN